jgi:hypothetical protein
VRKIVSLLFILTSLLGAQAWKKYLLPQPRQLSGIVVDQQGRPIQAVSIKHTGEIPVRGHETDAQGRFEFKTDAPAIVFRKEGYDSVFVRNDVSDIRIVLNSSHPAEFHDCQSTARLVSIDGWRASFAFQQIEEVTVSSQGRDIDYGARNYSIGKGKSARGIMHGSGPMWDFGTPSDFDVWRSVQYEETLFTKGEITIRVARGQFSNGNRWRYLGQFGESASYSDVEPGSADILDKFLDGACWKTQPRK